MTRTTQKRADEVRAGDRVMVAELGAKPLTVAAVLKGPYTRKSVMFTYKGGGFSSLLADSIVSVVTEKGN